MHDQLGESRVIGQLKAASIKSPNSPRGYRKLLQVAADEFQAVHPRFLMVQLIVSLLPHNALCRVRTILYRMAGFKIGKGALILGKLTLTSDGPMAKMLTVGCGSRINSPFYAELNAHIMIGDKVAIGHNVVFITTDHDTSDGSHRAGSSVFNQIVIEDGAMIGARATILPGVVIGRGSIVAAGALVSQSVLPNRVVGGVPARPVKTLDG